MMMDIIGFIIIWKDEPVLVTLELSQCVNTLEMLFSLLWVILRQLNIQNVFYLDELINVVYHL